MLAEKNNVPQLRSRRQVASSPPWKASSRRPGRRADTPARLLLLGSVAAVLGCLAAVQGAQAHFDNPDGLVSLYTVRLNSITVTVNNGQGDVYETGNSTVGGSGVRIHSGQDVTLLIHTATDAEGHDMLKEAIFSERGRVGERIDVGRLIYYHVDCSPSEKLSLTMNVALLGFGVPQEGYPVRGLLHDGGGIVIDREEGAPGRGTGGLLHGAIQSAFGGRPKLPQYISKGEKSPYVLLDNSGTGDYVPRQPDNRPIPKEEASYEFNATFRHRPIPPPTLCKNANRNRVIKKLAEDNKEIGRTLGNTTDEDGDGIPKNVERACGTDDHNAAEVPRFRDGVCRGIARLPRTCEGRLATFADQPDLVRTELTCRGRTVLSAFSETINRAVDSFTAPSNRGASTSFVCRSARSQGALTCAGGRQIGGDLLLGLTVHPAAGSDLRGHFTVTLGGRRLEYPFATPPVACAAGAVGPLCNRPGGAQVCAANGSVSSTNAGVAQVDLVCSKPLAEVVAQYPRAVQPGAAAWFGNGGSGSCNQPSPMIIDCGGITTPARGQTRIAAFDGAQVGDVVGVKLTFADATTESKQVQLATAGP